MMTAEDESQYNGKKKKKDKITVVEWAGREENVTVKGNNKSGSSEKNEKNKIK